MTTAPSTTTDEAPQPAATPPRKSNWATLRPLILRLHFYAGVVVAPFLLVAALTGLLYAASFQAEKIVYDHELTVPVGDRKLPVSEQVAAARKAHPQGTVSAVRPSPEADATTRVMLSGVPGVDPDHTLAVFVDPYTAEVRGALEQYGSTGALPLRTWIDEFHRDLHLGETGRLYSEFAASWLWVIAGGGVVLWLSRRRALRKVRGTSGRRRTLGLHGSVGLWAAAGFVFLSATGLTWSTYAGANIDELRTALGHQTPTVTAAAALVVAALFGVQANRTQEQLNAERDRSREIAHVLAAPDARASTGRDARGRTIGVIASASAESAIVTLGGYGEPPDGRVRQLWLMRPDAQPRSLGLFEGDTPLVASGLDTSATSLAVTVEPDGGSPQPTTQPIVQLALEAVGFGE
ncbi:PepSY domain-containing protein [Streptomyces sp. 15-116A]|uniref:anti-sigma factor n=1 Tax=Streptomyces sp. 15-116A TaxID=2259035 RepID=UPI0021B2FE0D|nr:PepSY-associated TM helix domain-containing protein [Streptomyces sp. 15-116A]MCT7353352.1 PepSY domain-containing protein [Streptomyces sp. 15-116A]